MVVRNITIRMRKADGGANFRFDGVKVFMAGPSESGRINDNGQIRLGPCNLNVRQ
jgi:hypothetical protein